MGVLRDRMVREMSLREFSASTQTLYLATLTDLAKYHHRSPDTLDPTQVPESCTRWRRAEGIRRKNHLGDPKKWGITRGANQRVLPPWRSPKW